MFDEGVIQDEEIAERVAMAKKERSTMNLFVYGTLSMPEIVRRLGLTVPKFVDASVTGYRTMTWKDVPFPLLMEDSTGVVKGFVWKNIQTRQMETIRRYEGRQYAERRVWAYDKDGQKHDCSMFVMHDLPQAGWTPEHAHRFYNEENER